MSDSESDEIWDYIVIGGGLTGLGMAALLSFEGSRVLLLEKEPIVLFIINKGLTTLKVGETYEDQGCSAVVNSASVTCDISSNTVNIEVPGIYIVTYSVTVGTDTYSYDRYLYMRKELN